jgi:hypothetical protein
MRYDHASQTGIRPDLEVMLDDRYYVMAWYIVDSSMKGTVASYSRSVAGQPSRISMGPFRARETNGSRNGCRKYEVHSSVQKQ